MRKVLVIILAVLMFTSVLAGCKDAGSTLDPTQKPDTTVNPGETVEPDPYGKDFAGYPMQTGEELTVWTNQMATHAEYVDASESPYHQWISEFTGVKVNWEMPAVGADTTQAYTLMLSSADLPDIIYTDSLTSRGVSLLEDGTIIPITDYMDVYAPSLLAWLKLKPDLDLAVKTDAGEYFNFPFMREDVGMLGTWQGPAVRQDLLQQFSLDEPVTIADWDEMLHKFKEEADIPLSVYGGVQLRQWFGNAFGFNSTYVSNYFVEDSNVKSWFNADGYKDFLTQMKTWFADGLIDPDFVTIDMTGLVSKVATNEVGSVFMGSGTVSRFKPALQENKFDYNYIPASYPVKNEGDVIKFAQGDHEFLGPGAVITASCENVPLALRFLDYGYTEQGVITYNFGKEGETYEMVDGKPVFTDLVLQNPEGLSSTLQRYTPFFSTGPSVVTVDFYTQKTDPAGVASVTKWIDNTDLVPYQLPPVTPTADEMTELSDLETAISTYAEEMYYNFILGSESLDNFDAYLNTLKEMGLDRVLEIKTEQLTRYLNR